MLINHHHITFYSELINCIITNTHAHTRTHIHTRTHTHKVAHAHAHAHTHTRTRTLPSFITSFHKFWVVILFVLTETRMATTRMEANRLCTISLTLNHLSIWHQVSHMPPLSVMLRRVSSEGGHHLAVAARMPRDRCWCVCAQYLSLVIFSSSYFSCRGVYASKINKPSLKRGRAGSSFLMRET